MSVLSPDALQERLQALIRPGDTLWWGQATAEPLTLTRAVVAQRHALARHGGQGRLRVFVGMGASDTLQPAHADAIDFFGYAAGGPHRALAQAGVLVRTGSAGLLRLVTHRHIDDAAVDSTLQAFARLQHPI